MRITTILLLAACMEVQAYGYSQGKITLTEKNASLKTVLDEIGQQTGYQYLFSEQLAQQAKKIDITVTNASLEEVLGICFKDQPFTYTIIKKIIVVKERENLSLNTLLPAIVLELKGRVTNESGKPLAGASVMVKGSKKGTLTDEKGMFILDDVPAEAILEITYTGYQSKEILVKGEKSITIVLVVATGILDQIKIIPYGTTTERLTTGDVSSVTSKEIEQQPVADPLLAMEGRVPGMFITQSTGLPGSGVTVRIQGQNSIIDGNDPLYVVDGVPYIAQLPLNLANTLGGSGGSVNGQSPGFGNPLSYINPSDIESISVLKDADATAIYGSRAANGAVLITTKKGKPGKLQADINLQNGFGRVTHHLDLLNTPQYLTMRHEAFKNDGATPSSTDYDLNGTWDTTRYTDWQKALIGGTAQYANYDLSFSGGSATTQLLMGSTFHKETSVSPGGIEDQKGAVHVSLTNVSENKRFHLQLSVIYQIDNNRLLSTDLTGYATQLAPVAPSLYNKDGSLNWMPTVNGTSSFTVNPLKNIYNPYIGQTNNLISNTSLSYQILPGLEISSSLGYTNLLQKETKITALLSTAPEKRSTTQSTALYGNNSVSSWIVEPQITYKHILGLSTIQVLVGTTIQQSNTSMQQLQGTGYSSDLLLPDILSASSIKALNTATTVYKYNAGFGRLNYMFKDKYIVDLVARRDGSSRFGSNNEFHNFGSVSGGWIFSQEEFIKRHLSVISFGKIRSSYGVTGNDQIGDYQYLNNFQSNGYSYQGVVGLTAKSLPNPYLQWEETRKFQLGLDLGLFQDRILLNSTFYRNRSSNELLSYALPIITGFNSIAANFPAKVQNVGAEFTLNTKNIVGKTFSWTSSFNLTIPDNKLISFPNLASSSYASSLVVGKSINSVKVFHYLGVNDTTGEYQFASSHGTPTYNPNITTDKTVVLNRAPKLFGGLENNIRYKSIELDFLLQIVHQIGAYYIFNTLPPGYFNNGTGNQPEEVLSRWQNAGDIAPIQRFNQNLSLYTANVDAQQSDFFYRDASFVRLKNVSLSWQIPENVIRKAHLRNCKFYVSAQNLFTLTHYQGLDPETLSSSTLPTLRLITVGIQAGL